MEQQRIERVLCLLMLAVIGLYCILSALFGSVFAKIHLMPLGIHLPLFVGEMLLIVLFGAYVALRVNARRPLVNVESAWALFGLYILFLLALGHKPCLGLSLRNAALYYYAFFAVFTCVAFQRSRVPHALRYVVLALILAIFVFITSDSYFRYTFLMLGIGLILHFPKGKRRWLAAVLLAGFSMPANIFSGARTGLVASVAALLYLVIVFIALPMTIQRRKRLFIIIFAGVVIGFALWIKGDHNGLRSIIDYHQLQQRYASFEENIEKKHYEEQPLKIALYHEGAQAAGGVLATGAIQPVTRQTLPQKTEPSLLPEKESLNTLPVNSKEEDRQFRDYGVACNNILFRYFIWRDMVRELNKRGAWMTGVGLGWPQRSPSIEVLNWANSEWSHDGWITPHNLFLHVVYRCGLIGLGLIVVLIGWMVKVTQVFLKARYYPGLLLVSAMVYWLMASQVLVVLELPYYAIPFWALTGIVWALAKRF